MKKANSGSLQGWRSPFCSSTLVLFSLLMVVRPHHHRNLSPLPDRQEHPARVPFLHHTTRIPLPASRCSRAAACITPPASHHPHPSSAKATSASAQLPGTTPAASLLGAPAPHPRPGCCCSPQCMHQASPAPTAAARCSPAAAPRHPHRGQRRVQPRGLRAPVPRLQMNFNWAAREQGRASWRVSALRVISMRVFISFTDAASLCKATERV